MGQHIDLGFIDIPIDYSTFTEDQKSRLCDKLIDALIVYIDKELEYAPFINRITFLNEVLESTLITNEYYENYEVCSVIRDCKKRLNED